MEKGWRETEEGACREDGKGVGQWEAQGERVGRRVRRNSERVQGRSEREKIGKEGKITVISLSLRT